MIGLKGNRTVRIGFFQTFDLLKADDPRVKGVASGQLINYQLQRANILPVMLDQLEHGFHFFILLYFHGLEIIGAAFGLAIVKSFDFFSESCQIIL